MNNQKATPSAGANAGGHREERRDHARSFGSSECESLDGTNITQLQNEVSEEKYKKIREFFPEELLQQKRWAVSMEGQKRPYCPQVPEGYDSVSVCSSVDPDTWFDFETCATAPNPMMTRVGLFMDPEDRLIVVDVDDITAHEHIQALTEHLPNTYVEYSWSGNPDNRKMHIFVYGDLPANFKAPGIEAYKADRYIGVTGNAINGAVPITEQQPLLDSLWGTFGNASEAAILTGVAAPNVGNIDIGDRQIRQEDCEYLKPLRNDPVWNGTTDQDNMRHHGGEKDGRWNSEAELFVAKAVRKKVGRDDGALIFRLTCASPVIREKIEYSAAEEKRIPKRIAKYTIPTACAHVAEEEADALLGKELGGSLLKGIIQERVSDDEPVPLSEVKRGDPPFPVDALSPVLRDAAKEIHRTQGADLAICCQSLLLASALAVQPHYDVEITGIGKRPCSLFGVTLGKSSARKSTVDKYALAEHDRHEEELVLARESSMKQYEVDEMIYKKRKESVGKRIAKLTESLNPSDRENIMVEQSRLGPPPNKPYEVVLTGTDPTVEGVTRVFREGVVNFGIFADEGSKLFGGYGMNKDNATKTAGAFSNLWDGQPVDVIRGGSEIQKFFGRRVSMHLMVQPKVFQITLSNDEVRDQGFLNRFLYVAPKPKIKKSYVAESLEENEALQAYYRLIKNFLEHPVRVADNEASPTGRRLTPHLITAGEGVVARFAKYHDDNEARADVAGDEEHYYSYFAKLPEQAMRIAGVLSAIEGHQEITLDVMERSIQIANYYWAQALLVFDKAELDGQHEDALAMHTWIMRRGDENHRVGRRWLVSRVTPKRLQGNKSATPVLDDLLRLGWVENEGPGECTYEQGGKIKTERFDEVIRAVEIPE